MRGVVLGVFVLVGCAGPRERDPLLPIDEAAAIHHLPAASLRIVDTQIDANAVPQVKTMLTTTIETNVESGEWRLVREKTGQFSRSTQTTKAAQIVFEGDGEVFVAAMDCQDPTSAKGRLFIFDNELNVRGLFSIAPLYFVGIERTPTSLRAMALPKEDSPCADAATATKLAKPMLVEIDHLERHLFDHRSRKHGKPIFVE